MGAFTQHAKGMPKSSHLYLNCEIMIKKQLQQLHQHCGSQFCGGFLLLAGALA